MKGSYVCLRGLGRKVGMKYQVINRSKTEDVPSGRGDIALCKVLSPWGFLFLNFARCGSCAEIGTACVLVAVNYLAAIWLRRSK